MWREAPDFSENRTVNGVLWRQPFPGPQPQAPDVPALGTPAASTAGRPAAVAPAAPLYSPKVRLLLRLARSPQWGLHEFCRLSYRLEPSDGSMRARLAALPRLWPATARRAACRHSATPIQRPLTKLGHPALARMAVAANRQLLGFSGDLPADCPGALGQRLLRKGLTCPELRDEIYLHVCRLLTENGARRSERRGWAMLLMCLDLFPPSSELKLHLLHFLQRRLAHPVYANFAARCQDLLLVDACLTEAELAAAVAARQVPTLDYIHAAAALGQVEESEGSTPQPESVSAWEQSMRVMAGSKCVIAYILYGIFQVVWQILRVLVYGIYTQDVTDSLADVDR